MRLGPAHQQAMASVFRALERKTLQQWSIGPIFDPRLVSFDIQVRRLIAVLLFLSKGYEAAQIA